MKKRVKRDFENVQNRLFKQTSKTINNVKLKTQDRIEKLNKDLIKGLELELREITEEVIVGTEEQLNHELTQGFREFDAAINQMLVEMYADLKYTVYDLIQMKIKKNYAGYQQYLIKKIRNSIELIGNEFVLSLNERDMQNFEQITRELNDCEITRGKILSIIGGCVIEDVNHQMEIDLSIDSDYQSNEDNFKALLVNAVPNTSFEMQSASLLIRQKEIRQHVEYPKFFTQFVKKIKEETV